MFGGKVTQPSQPLPEMSRSPEPLSIATGKVWGGVPISTEVHQIAVGLCMRACVRACIHTVAMTQFYN